MEQVLENKVVLITGGARRVGAAIARKVHAAGGTLVIHYHRSALEAQALAAELNAVRPSSVTASTTERTRSTPRASCPVVGSSRTMTGVRMARTDARASSFRREPPRS